ncbi:hypothetical protein Tco_0918357, partial [Tanacetum coccineum]
MLQEQPLSTIPKSSVNLCGLPCMRQNEKEDDQEQPAEVLTTVFTLSSPKYEKDDFGSDALCKGPLLAGTALPVGTRVGKFCLLVVTGVDKFYLPVGTALPVGTGVDKFDRVELRSTIPD